MRKRGEKEDLQVAGCPWHRGASNCDKQEVSLEEVEKVFHMLSLR